MYIICFEILLIFLLIFIFFTSIIFDIIAKINISTAKTIKISSIEISNACIIFH